MRPHNIICNFLVDLFSNDRRNCDTTVIDRKNRRSEKFMYYRGPKPDHKGFLTVSNLLGNKV